MSYKVSILWLRIWRDSRAQATTEYILLLAVIVGVAVSVFKKLLAPGMKVLSESVLNLIEDRLSGKSGDGFHRFNYRK
ncbi:MAG: hypothetical protein AABZ55_05340 [Bdellovibrionota bacterium]